MTIVYTTCIICAGAGDRGVGDVLRIRWKLKS